MDVSAKVATGYLGGGKSSGASSVWETTIVLFHQVRLYLSYRKHYTQTLPLKKREKPLRLTAKRPSETLPLFPSLDAATLVVQK